MQQILLFIISLILKLTFAQQKEKTIKGIVKDNNGVIVYAHVLNKTTNEGTITNEQGMFLMCVLTNVMAIPIEMNILTKNYTIKDMLLSVPMLG